MQSLWQDLKCEPITVAAQSKVWTVFSRSNTGILGSNFTRVMDVYVRFCVWVVTLRRTDPSAKDSYQLCTGLRNWKGGQGLAEGLQSQR
jgi:hypothetical protein